jgi:trehalose 6-phosphate phosphatase
MRDAVRDVATYFPTAIITGRSIEKVKSFVQLEELYYAGSHGMDIKGPSNGDRAVNYQPDVEILPMIDEVYKAASETIKSIPGALAENNKFSVYRFTTVVLINRVCLHYLTKLHQFSTIIQN